MKTEPATENRHILVIDDNTSIHEDFCKILSPKTDGLDQARVALFGEEPTLPLQQPFEIDVTDQGQKGVGFVHTALQKGRPYAVAFVDMRMPPGWDGLETIEHLWHVDPDLEIVVCTAYSDHPWEVISRRIGQTDKLLILMKPFNSVEVVQLAHSLTTKWNLRREVKLQIESLASCVTQRTAQLQEANERFQQEIAQMIAEAAKEKSADRTTATFRAKEEFVAIMSHEILASMNVLVGHVTLLLDGPLSHAQRSHAASLQQSAHDLMALINDLHEFMVGPGKARDRQVDEAG